MSSFSSTDERLSFRVLEARLVGQITKQLRNGDFTERGLARMVGISQSQMHNVLKGARKLTPDLADRLLAHFDMSILDLLRESEIVQASSAPGSADRAMAAAHVHLAMMRNGFTPRTRSSREESLVSGDSDEQHTG